MSQGSRRRVFLASGSPRRRQLAEAEGWDVVVVPPPDHVERNAPPPAPDEPLGHYVTRLARAKGEAVAAELAAAGGIGSILACDTIGELDGMPLGKPVDRDDARRMLGLLSGRTHRVLTGVWIAELVPHASAPVRRREAVDESLLEMEPLTDDVLDWYLDSGLWQGKAGACGFQDERLPLRLLAGSGSNVVGLPLELLRRLLA
jgi:septum formation protein